PLFLAHLGSTPAPAVMQYGRWLFVHDGEINRFEAIKPDLLAAVNPSLINAFVGSSDSEVLLALAITFGLSDDPVAGLGEAVGGERRGETRRAVRTRDVQAGPWSDGWRAGWKLRAPAGPRCSGRRSSSRATR